MTLHIANGSSGTAALNQAGMEGDFLAWDDVLHLGPIPAGLSIQAMAAIRGRFISSCGWSAEGEAIERFHQRDAKLEHALAEKRPVFLWNTFELFDQLHLLQIGERLANADPVFVVFYDGYLGHGFSDRGKAQTLLRAAVPITPALLEQIRVLWDALTDPSPQALNRWVHESIGSLPFMASGVRRLLQEYPWRDSGVSRTELQLLNSFQGPATGAELFVRSQKMEAVRFMGDWAFWLWLSELCMDDAPLVEPVARKHNTQRKTDHACATTTYRLTSMGEQVRSGEASRTAPRWRERLTRWIGGVELGTGSDWRWCPRQNQVIALEDE